MSTTAIDPPFGTPHSPWLNALVANIQDAIVLLDADGRVTFESPSACEILGIPPDDVLGAFGIKRIHPDERDTVVRSFERTIAVPGSVSRATYRFQRADGDWRHLEALAKNLLHDPDLHGVLITFRDVTERTRALAAAEDAARRKDALFAHVGGELRPCVDGMLDGLRMMSIAEGSRRQAAEHVAEAGARLLNVVEELMLLTAPETGGRSLEIQALDLHSTLDAVRDLTRSLASRRDVRVLLTCDPAQGLSVYADAERLRQVLFNLLAAAIRHNTTGEIIVQCAGSAEGPVRLTILDAGPGIPDTVVQRVFDRVDRIGMDAAGDQEDELGLAVSSRLIARMGGAMGVESRPGAGALIWIELPRPPELDRAQKQETATGSADRRPSSD